MRLISTAASIAIRHQGKGKPVWIYQGKLIDGRNRYTACEELGIEAKTRTWNGQGSLVSFVLSLNLQRRHLTPGQRAAIGVEVEERFAVEAKEKQREHGNTAPNKPKSLVEIIPQVISETPYDADLESPYDADLESFKQDPEFRDELEKQERELAPEIEKQIASPPVVETRFSVKLCFSFS